MSINITMHCLKKGLVRRGVKALNVSTSMWRQCYLVPGTISLMLLIISSCCYHRINGIDYGFERNLSLVAKVQKCYLKMPFHFSA